MLPNGSLFICGGYCPPNHCIITAHNDIVEIPTMLKVRCRHSIAYFKGYVYVFGGESSDAETTLA